MKSAVSVLHEFMVLLHLTPKYVCISEFGKQHKPVFRYRCSAIGETVTGTGRSKKEAKQVVARVMLQKLSRNGFLIPPEYACPETKNDMMRQGVLPERNYVTMVAQLCKEFGLNDVQYELSPDTGSRSHPRYTVTARTGLVERHSTTNIEKVAYQLAAEQIYKHLRTKIGATSAYFNEQDALYREYEIVKARNEGLEEMIELGSVLKPDDTSNRRQAKKKYFKKKNSNKSQPKTAMDVVEETIRLEIDLLDEPNIELSGISPVADDEQNDPDDNVAGTSSAATVALWFIERTMDKLGL